MTYTGEVVPGGAADVRQLADLTITKISVGPMDNNAYLLRCAGSGEQVLIDAANDADRLLELIGSDGLDTVVTTHRHADHWQALTAVLDATGARSLAHDRDADGIPVVNERLQDGETVRVGDCQLEVVHLVGHTPGSIALVYRDPAGHPHVFTGDALFPGGVGNTHGNRYDFESLLGDVESKLFDRLPDDTWVYPGHGKDTTLGTQRPALPEWRARGW